jgi:H/ACA ribonucleoprotein complex subunit 4
MMINPADEEEKILIRTDEEEQTDSKYGVHPEERPIEEYIRKGIINLDKPSGPTSHQVTEWVKEILKVKKVGHSGTLDPKVTGVLPTLLEESTKVAPAFLLAKKEYVGILRLHKDAEIGKIKKIFEYFRGKKIYQKPPLKSVVKRKLRVKEIYDFELIENEGKEILFRVVCESGTYVRKLCHDIGLILGTGANMQELRRTKVGVLDEQFKFTTLHELKDAYEFYREEKDEDFLKRVILPMEKCIGHLKKIWVSDNGIDALCHGADLYAPGVVKLSSDIEENELIALMSLKNELIALGRSLKSSQGIFDANKGVVATLERVIMEQGTYPRKWRK